MKEKVFYPILMLKIIILYGLAIIGCRQSHMLISSKITDVFQSSKNFEVANQLRYTQDYEEAVIAYTTELQEMDLTQLDSLYLINQISYCQLIINKVEGVERKLQVAEKILSQVVNPPKPLVADYFFNQGRYLFLQKKSDAAIEYTHRALQHFYQVYPSGHLKIAQTLTLLSLIHSKDGNLTDSIHYYSLLANDFFLTNPELQKYDWENDYVLGYSSLLHRAHERGEYYGRTALKKLRGLPFDNNWLEARAINLLANLIKKQAYAFLNEDSSSLESRKLKSYETADSLFQEAILIGQEEQDTDLIEFYIDWIINISRFADSTYFFKAMDISKQQFYNNDKWLPHYNRLLGFYYYGLEIEKTIYHYNTFLKTVAPSDPIDYRIYADSYYCLRNSYKKLRDFEKAAYYAKQSFLLYDCATEAFDIYDPNTIELLDGTKRYCLAISGFFAEDLLEKYKVERQEKDLQLANAYFEFVEQHSFKSLLSKDEDAFLSFQYEAGNIIYGKAIESASEAWKLTQNPYWLNKIFNYMEYLKSYLLYRDMLKKEKSHSETYTLSDSIRIMQGQVNQLFFSLKKGKKLSSNNDLVNTLIHLENRRTERLNNFELKIYQNLLKVTDIKEHLGRRNGVVSYFNTNNYLFGIFISQDTTLFFQKAKADNFIENALQDFRLSIGKEVKLDKTTIRKYLSSGRSLYQVLIQPFENQLSKIEQLIVIPDQLLSDIPFEALLSKTVDSSDVNFRTLPYLLYQTKLVYTSSWKVYTTNQSKIATHFNDKSIGFWTTPELQANNGLEIIEKSIQLGFETKYELFSPQKGGKKLFAQRHSQFDILHLLLHASSSKTIRYDNRIRFGNMPDDVLYGFDLYKERFKSKLLVLASCESAIGTAKEGEGTFSLARSFINSGVPEVLAAQFLIPQTTTAPLLAQFYKNLAKGNTAAQALHSAKIDYLKNISKERHAYPRFWAGMVLFN